MSWLEVAAVVFVAGVLATPLILIIEGLVERWGL